MFREILMASYMSSMSGGVGITCDMGLDGRSEINVGSSWTEHERPDGKKFYVNQKDGRRTWRRPAEALPEEGFEKCRPFVQRLRYHGRYPAGVETELATPQSGYDCESFLERLYAANQQKWEKLAPQSAVDDSLSAEEVARRQWRPSPGRTAVWEKTEHAPWTPVGKETTQRREAQEGPGGSVFTAGQNDLPPLE